jgi:hypothetical protein
VTVLKVCDRSEFELNAEERQRRVLAAEEHQAEVTLEERARQVAKRKAAAAVRKEVWDEMEVKGMAIQVQFAFIGDKTHMFWPIPLYPVFSDIIGLGKSGTLGKELPTVPGSTGGSRGAIDCAGRAEGR